MHPKETGGLLFGYWAVDQIQTVVTTVSFPGPNAIHAGESYKPDYAHDDEVAAIHYGTTNGQETYLGDWHTHPGVKTPMLSRKDRVTMKRIAAHGSARAPRPVMAIACGKYQIWELNAWVGESTPILFGFTKRLKIQASAVCSFGPSESDIRPDSPKADR